MDIHYNTSRFFRIRPFLAGVAFILLAAGCAPTTGTSGGSSSSTSSGNGCNNGYCNSNGYCCPRGTIGCQGYCYDSTQDAYSATGNSSCLSSKTIC